MRRWGEHPAVIDLARRVEAAGLIETSTDPATVAAASWRLSSEGASSTARVQGPVGHHRRRAPAHRGQYALPWGGGGGGVPDIRKKDDDREAVLPSPASSCAAATPTPMTPLSATTSCGATGGRWCRPGDGFVAVLDGGWPVSSSSGPTCPGPGATWPTPATRSAPICGASAWARDG